MPDENVNIVFTAIDNASSAITGIRGAILTFNQTMQTARQVYQAVNTVIEQTVGVYVKYADQVRVLSQLNGTNAEETSRLIQVTDDFKVSQDGLTMATKKLSAEGRSLTVDTLAKMSDEYNKLRTSAEKTKFLIDNFGRTGTQFAEIMQAGSAAIRDQSAAISQNLILTQQNLIATRKYEAAVNDLNDAWKALVIGGGKGGTSWLTTTIKLTDFAIDSNNLLISGHWSLLNVGKLLGEHFDSFNAALGLSAGRSEEWADYLNRRLIPAIGDGGDSLEEFSTQILTAAGSFSSMGMRADVVKLALGQLSQAEFDNIVALHNFDAAVAAWGNKPITKKIVIEMWMNAFNDLRESGYAQNYSGGMSYGQTGGSGGGQWVKIGTMNGPGTPDVWKNTVTGLNNIGGPGKATGGMVAPGQSAIVGDSVSGIPTGYEEMIIALPGGGVRVVPNNKIRGRDVRGLPHFASDAGGGGIGGGNVASGGGSNWHGFYPEEFPNAGLPYNQGGGGSNWHQFYPNEFGGGSGAAPQSAVIQSAVQTAVSAAMTQVTSQASATAAPVTAAAIKISESSEKTTRATQSQTEQNNQGNAVIVSELQKLNRFNRYELPRMIASAVARNQ